MDYARVSMKLMLKLLIVFAFLKAGSLTQVLPLITTSQGVHLELKNADFAGTSAIVVYSFDNGLKSVAIALLDKILT